MKFLILILSTTLWIGAGFWFYYIAYSVRGDKKYNFFFAALGIILYYITYEGQWKLLSKFDIQSLMGIINKYPDCIYISTIILLALEGLLLRFILKLFNKKISPRTNIM